MAGKQKTVGELRVELDDYSDAGVAETVKTAIDSLIGLGVLRADSDIDAVSLEEIRQMIYSLHYQNGGEEITYERLFEASLYSIDPTSADPAAAAVIYIRDLKSALR